jgi:CheY-like chemotaxis protein
MAIKGPIIIVDDDDDDHYILKRVCEKLGITTPLLFFSDGKKVLTYLKSTTDKPFIILCDVNMPVMNGLELKKQIDSDVELKKKGIPFIFFSTSAMASIVRDAFAMSVQGFFIKAQSLEELENTLKVIFEYWERCEHPSLVNP